MRADILETRLCSRLPAYKAVVNLLINAPVLYRRTWPVLYRGASIQSIFKRYNYLYVCELSACITSTFFDH